MSTRIVGIILKPMLSVGEKSGVRRLAIQPEGALIVIFYVVLF